VLAVRFRLGQSIHDVPQHSIGYTVACYIVLSVDHAKIRKFIPTPGLGVLYPADEGQFGFFCVVLFWGSLVPKSNGGVAFALLQYNLFIPHIIPKEFISRLSPFIKTNYITPPSPN
jgi:hypothetical protein